LTYITADNGVPGYLYSSYSTDTLRRGNEADNFTAHSSTSSGNDGFNHKIISLNYL
jgi:hypothetical protein